jgi:predicted ATP-grasp superfamily ATP-dependent carboligase/thymidylate kinase
MSLAPARLRRVLVTDAGRGSAVAVIRSLGRRGWQVVAADSDRYSPGFRSRYTWRRLRHPDLREDPRGAASRIAAAVEAWGIDLVIPVTDEAILALQSVREQLEHHARLAIPGDDALDRAADKEQSLQLAEQLGLPVPRFRIAWDADTALQAAEEIGWPVVLKPTRSRHWTPGEAIAASSVRSVSSPTELRAAMASLRGERVLVQEFWPGEGHGVEVLADAGRPLLLFQHRRLREVPPWGGSSAFRESADLDPALADHAVRLLHAMHWRGLAMVEFRVGPRGPAFMEVNGRIWGSLPLALQAGVDFPGALADLVMDDRQPPVHVTGGLPGSYPTGVRSRSLSLEISWIGTVLARRTAGPVPLPPRREALRVALRLLSPRDGWDMLSTEDPGPGLAEIARVAASIPARLAARRPGRPAHGPGVAPAGARMTDQSRNGAIRGPHAPSHAVSVALVGPDGAGKTTVGRRLEDELAGAASYLYMGVNADSGNRLLPTTRLRRALGRRGGSVPPSGRDLERISEPAVAPRGTAATARGLLGLGNRVLEEWYRQAIAWSHLRRGRTVIFDRHYLLDYHATDIAAPNPPLARRIHGLLLRHVYPRPDLVIFLDAPAEVLHARKGEGTIEFLEQRRQAYLAAGQELPRFVVVDATQPLDTVVGQVAELIRSNGA